MCEDGYWWLAYDWDNYLLSCTLCNRPYKGTLFPIKEQRPAHPDPASEYPCENPKQGDQETPLLMNPFDPNLEPSEHLEFTESGLIKHKTDTGKETIETLGLSRDSLNTGRIWAAKKIFQYFKNFANAAPGSDAEKLFASEIVSMGDETSIASPGMCRIIYENLVDGQGTWEAFENKWKAVD